MFPALLLLLITQLDTDEDRIRLAREIDDRALNLNSAGRNSDAASQLARSLKIWEELSARRNIDLIGPHFNLASTYLALGRIAAAEREARVARSLSNRDTPADHVRRIGSLMANIHVQKGEYAQAERELRVILHETKGLERLTALNDLGMVRASLGDLKGARQLLESAVAERMKLQPDHGLDVGQFIANLALVRLKDGDTKDAMSLYRQAIPMLEVLPPGPMRARLGMALAEMSQALSKAGRKAEAKHFHERAKAVFGENLDPASLRTVDIGSFR
jgi:tetratricopeptide (TPR) repeat protein